MCYFPAFTPYTLHFNFLTKKDDLANDNVSRQSEQSEAKNHASS